MATAFLILLSGASIHASTQSICRSQVEAAWAYLRGGHILRVDHSGDNRLWTVIGRDGRRMTIRVNPETTECLTSGDPSWD